MKHYILILAALLSMLMPVQAAGNDFRKAEEAYMRGDYRTALKAWTPLAEEGDLTAQIYLANMYRKGKGVPLDYKRALKWYTLPAEHGNAVAQYNLGVMYNFGLGVLQEYKTALKWYSLSAAQGNIYAQYNLGRLYYLGQGVTENIVYAHMWTNLASSTGFEMSENLKSLVTEQMSPSQIEQAQELARLCVVKNYKSC